MKLRFTPRATQDLIAIADYIRTRNPAASLRVRGAILDSLQNLVLWPEVGRRQTVEGVRKLVTRKYPYLVRKRSRRALPNRLLETRDRVDERPQFVRSPIDHLDRNVENHGQADIGDPAVVLQ